MSAAAPPRKLLVVGGGAAGLSACYHAYRADPTLKITLVEEDGRIGGHSFTIFTPGQEQIDLGFQVFNLVTYPNMLRVFGELGIPLIPSDMSFAISSPGLEWSFRGDSEWYWNNLWRPRLWRFLLHYKEFIQRSKAYLADQRRDPTKSIGQVLEGMSPQFIDGWLVPFVLAVWSVDTGGARDFAALPLLRFMHNHGFLQLVPHEWLTLKHRSKSYVSAILFELRRAITLKSDNAAVRIDSEKKVVELKDGSIESYDALILACSAPRARALGAPQQDWLSRFRVTESMVYAHKDSAMMPKDEKNWCSWNVDEGATSEEGKPVLTYWTSRLQSLKDRNVFITLNKKPDEDYVFWRGEMSHPVMDVESFAAQQELATRQGLGGVYYAGAWLRHGFHEDGFLSGILAVRAALGLKNIPVEYPVQVGGTATPVCGSTAHTRMTPVKRTFVSDLWLWRFDTRFPPVGFDERDHLAWTDREREVRDAIAQRPGLPMPLDSWLRREVSRRHGEWPAGPIHCVTHLRWLNHTFNPITPYYVYGDEDEEVVAKGELPRVRYFLVEVQNTPWSERVLYSFRVGADGVTLEQPTVNKSLHVSPFNPPPAAAVPAAAAPDVTPDEAPAPKPRKRGGAAKTPAPFSSAPPAWTYTFTLLPDQSFRLATKDPEGVTVLVTSLTYRPGTHATYAGGWRTWWGIHMHAVKLLLRGVPFHGYADQAPGRRMSHPLMLSSLIYAVPAFAAGVEGLWGRLALCVAAMFTGLEWHRSRETNFLVTPVLLALWPFAAVGSMMEGDPVGGVFVALAAMFLVVGFVRRWTLWMALSHAFLAMGMLASTPRVVLFPSVG